MKLMPLITIALLMYSCLKQNTEQVEMSLKNFPQEMRLYIPVTIEDTILYFLWDTGSTYTTINRDIADKLKLSTIDKSSIVYVYQLHDSIPMQHTDYTKFRIGSNHIRTKLLIDDTVDSENSNGVIGQNIINRYYWLFDLTNQEAVMSLKPCEPNSENYAESFTMSFSNNNNVYSDLPFCNIKFNDTISLPIVFDSGMSGVLAKEVGYDLFIMTKDSTDNLSSFIRSLIKPRRFEIETEVGFLPNTVSTGFLIDSVKLHDKMLRKVLIMYDVNDYYKESLCFISSYFIKRFSLLYYDPFNKQINMYRRSSDTTVNNESKVYDYIMSAFGYK